MKDSTLDYIKHVLSAVVDSQVHEDLADYKANVEALHDAPDPSTIRLEDFEYIISKYVEPLDEMQFHLFHTYGGILFRMDLMLSASMFEEDFADDVDEIYTYDYNNLLDNPRRDQAEKYVVPSDS